MTITVERHSGVGIHSMYAIRRDGKLIATMDRGSSSKRGYTIYSVHYRERIGGGGRDIAAAINAAINLEYPTAQEIYETICQRTERLRRIQMEKERAHDFAQLARDLAAGSNSAQEKLIELANEIEVYAKDRSDTLGRRQKEREEAHRATGVWNYEYGNIPLYRLPPEKEAAEDEANAQLQHSGYPAI